MAYAADCRGDALSAARRVAEGRKALLSGVEGRHILTDTCGHLVHAVVHTADIQDRDGAPLVLKAIGKSFPWLRHIFADGGYAGDTLQGALAKIGKWTLEIIKRSDAAKGFVLLPRRWAKPVQGSRDAQHRWKAGGGRRAHVRRPSRRMLLDKRELHRGISAKMPTAFFGDYIPS